MAKTQTDGAFENLSGLARMFSGFCGRNLILIDILSASSISSICEPIDYTRFFKCGINSLPEWNLYQTYTVHMCYLCLLKNFPFSLILFAGIAPLEYSVRFLEFFSTHKEEITQEWIDYASTVLAGPALSQIELRNHSSHILHFIEDDILSLQTGKQQQDKSRGLGISSALLDIDNAAIQHTQRRYESGFDIVQMTSEFRALRASVMNLWSKVPDKDEDSANEINRFHEAIDQMLMESLAQHNDLINNARSLFLGTLIHDMRNPLGAALNCALLLPRVGELNSKQLKLSEQIGQSTQTVVKLVADLIDLTRAQLGKHLPITPAPANLGEIAKKAAEGAEASAAKGAVFVRVEGNLEGSWDNSRLAQAFSNLIGNALQHGNDNSIVMVKAFETSEGVTFSVHNEGEPIPPQQIPLIFDPLSRGVSDEQIETENTSLGLGLFISKEIITAHGGTIGVVSSKDGGTTFTAKLPRRVAVG